MGVDLLTSLLTAFQAVISLGMYNAGKTTANLYRILATIEIAALGIWWLLSRENNIGTIMLRVIVLSVFLWLMQEWQVLVGAMQASFMKLGIILGGNNLELGSVHSAGMTLINKGYEFSLAILGRVQNPTTLQAIEYALQDMAPTSTSTAKWVASWAVLFAFLICGIHVFAVQLEFVFFTALAFITIPFAAYNRTAWIAEKAFGSVVGSGLKLALLYMLASASIPVLKSYAMPLVPTQQNAVDILGAGILLLFLQVGARTLASAFLHGMPAFSHSDVLPRVGTALTVASLTTSTVARMNAGARAATEAGRRRP